jgi:hypothetical protein
MVLASDMRFQPTQAWDRIWRVADLKKRPSGTSATMPLRLFWAARLGH